MRREYTIIDEAGLHARPASLLVQVATKFPNEINIEYKGRKMILKSIMIVMSLGVSQNTTIAIEVDGDNAEEVFTALEEVLNSNNLI